MTQANIYADKPHINKNLYLGGMADYLKTHIEEHVLHILMQRGKSNAMHLEMIEELNTAFRDAEHDPAIEGVILTGNEGFFTSGLDLITLYQYDEIQMRLFWSKFIDLIRALTAFSKPFVAAISGHSPAGGCVLSIAADYRVMAEGDYIIGLNEVPVGIIVPHGIFDLYSFWIGRAKAYRYLLEGRLIKPEEALEIGLVDEVVPLNKIQNAAVRRIKTYAQFEKNAWRSTKVNLRQPLLESLGKDKDEVVKQVLEQWWRPSTRAILKTIIDNLTSKKT